MERATPATVSRSSPCPCGSGRRYKECHGALRSPEAGPSAPRSSYRPTGPDWDHLSESKRNFCGQMMGNALRLQTTGKENEAEQLYRDVLNVAPHTHDALHMLGVINFMRRDLVEAERLISEAMALRVEYPAIRKNLLLVRDAINARQQRNIQIVCELALPLLDDEVLLRIGENRPAASHAVQPTHAATGSSEPTHVVSAFGDPVGEREWFAQRVATLLGAQIPMLWSIGKPVAFAPDSRRMHTISTVDRRLPVGGLQILVGIDCDLEDWIEQAAPQRLLVFGLAASPARYLEQLRYLAANGAPPIELVFRSRAEALRFGCVGPILAPPIELLPTQTSIQTPPRSHDGVFTLGTLVREDRTVRAGDDGKLLEALAGDTCRLSIFAPGQMRYVLGGNRAIEFHSRRELSLPGFLARIEAFLHRVPDPWDEGCGLALFGAMARGLPVICSRDSLYAEYIEHERNGLLYSEDAEVVPSVQRLARDPEWARVIGDGARARSAELFDPATLAAAYEALAKHAPVALNS